MATVEKRHGRHGDVSWRARVRVGGQSRSKTFARRANAKAWAAAVENDLRYGRYVPDAMALRRTVGELIDRYIAWLPHKPRNRDQKSVKQMLEWWQGELGAVPVAQCTPAVVAALRDKLAAGQTSRRRARSPATVNRYLARLSHVFTVACKEWGWAEDNPVRRVSRLREAAGRTRFLSDQERTALLDACEVSPCPYLHLIVVLALSTGARRGEILGLRWRDVDLQRGRLVFRETKNGECRVAPLRGTARDALRTLGEVRHNDSDWVFPSLDGTRPRDIQTAWAKAVRAAGIDDFRFHDLRHSAASYLVMSGASDIEVAEILGHRTLQMVRRYSHLSDAHAGTVVARMNAEIFR